MSTEEIKSTFWVISKNYENDGTCIARLQHLNVKARPLPLDMPAYLCDRIELLRERFKSLGLVNMGRDPSDHESVVEYWA